MDKAQAEAARPPTRHLGLRVGLGRSGGQSSSPPPLPCLALAHGPILPILAVLAILVVLVL
eukprot:582616-Pyramimonas_sp.AAC.1